MNRASFFLGLGVALIVFSVAATFFHRFEMDAAGNIDNTAIINSQANESLVINRAKELGLDYPQETGQQAEITREELVRRAEELGMSFPPPATSVPTITPTAAPSTEAPEPELLSVTIVLGMGSGQIARLFEEAGIVENAEDFARYIEQRDKTLVLHSGEYHFPAGCDFETILDAIS